MSELRDLDDILDDRRHLVYVSDGTSGSEKVGRLLNDIAPLVAEVDRLRAASIWDAEGICIADPCILPPDHDGECER